MTTSLTGKIPVELWDEIFSFMFLLAYPSVFDFTSPFHCVYHLRIINDFDLHQWRRLGRCRTRLRLVCKDWNILISKNLRWIHRVSPRAIGLTVSIPQSPIAVLDCEDCPLDAMQMVIGVQGVHIRSLHIYLENLSEPTRGLVDMAKEHLPNLVALSIHIDWEPQPLLLCDISNLLPQLKALSLSAGRQTSRIGLSPSGVAVAASPSLSLGGTNCSMPFLEVLDLPSDSGEVLKVPSRLHFPVLRHLYGRTIDIQKSQAFLDRFGHQIHSLGLYGSALFGRRVSYEEFFHQLPNLTLFAVDFRYFKLLEAPPPTLDKLDTLVHLGPVYSELFNNSLVLKFMESSWTGSKRRFRMSDVWLPSQKSEVRTERIKKNTLHYSKDEYDVMMIWVKKFLRAGVRLEDMGGLTHAEAMRLSKGEVASR
jgi:hypothetical protein